MKRTKLILREIANYFFLQKTINRESLGAPLWKKFKLRASIWGRIYTIINLRDEDMGDDSEVRRFKALLLMKPINEYMQALDLHELIMPSIEEIPDTRSYLIVYTPLFRELTVAWLVSRILLISGSITAAIILLLKFI